MSTPPETEFDLDLHFLPAWAQEPATRNLYAKFEGGEERREERGRERGRGERRPREASRDRRGPRPERHDRRRPSHGGRSEERPRPAPEPLPDVEVQFRPDDNGVDSLARQIRMTGRAYPLFGIAQLILEKPERHSVAFQTRKNAEGAVIQPLFVCALDDTLWLNADDAVSYVLEKHFATFYQAERTQTDPPKGTYTFVAQCGMSGTILGPPNYHDYQNQLRKLHVERFSRMPFEAFKARVRIVRDEAVVKKWIEDQSWKTEYVCLNVPEPLKLSTREEVEKHFRQTHMAAIIREVESHQISGAASRSMPCRPLQRLVRVRWEDQKRFPLQVATVLSQQFAARGLQFFKVNKTVTHVAVARPHYLEVETTPVSENVKRIVEFINTHPKCTRRQLFEALAPSAVVTTQTAAESAPVPELTPEASAVITDLHWLIHQGHVIEFASGVLETAKRPVVKPPKPETPAAVEEAAVPAPASEPSASSAKPETPRETQTSEQPAPSAMAATDSVEPDSAAASAAPESSSTAEPESKPPNV